MALPAEFRVGDGARTAHEGDAAVAELVQVGQSLFDDEVMIEHDIGHVLGCAVGGDGYDRERHRNMVGRGVQQQKTIYSALHKHARILLDQLRFQSWQAVK